MLKVIQLNVRTPKQPHIISKTSKFLIKIVGSQKDRVGVHRVVSRSDGHCSDPTPEQKRALVCTSVLPTADISSTRRRITSVVGDPDAKCVDTPHRGFCDHPEFCRFVSTPAMSWWRQPMVLGWSLDWSESSQLVLCSCLRCDVCGVSGWCLWRWCDWATSGTGTQRPIKKDRQVRPSR